MAGGAVEVAVAGSLRAGIKEPYLCEVRVAAVPREAAVIAPLAARVRQLPCRPAAAPALGASGGRMAAAAKKVPPVEMRAAAARRVVGVAAAAKPAARAKPYPK